MKKSELKFGMEVMHNGKKVEVIDLLLPGTLDVVVAYEGESYVVGANNLSPVPTVVQTESGTRELTEEEKQRGCFAVLPEEEDKKEEMQVMFEDVHCKILYDKKTKAIYINLYNATTICITHLSEQIVDCIGIARKRDEDIYNNEIGMSLALFRAFQNETNKQNEEDDELPPFLRGFGM